MDVITDALAGPFQYSFMVRALIVAVIVGVMCPVAGVYVVTRGLGFMSDGLAHSVLPGIVAAGHHGNGGRQRIRRRHTHGHRHGAAQRLPHQAGRRW